MARTKQTARCSAGGSAPRRQLAAKSASELRSFLTTQQATGTVQRAGMQSSKPSSFLNFENVLGSFAFSCQPTDKAFAPRCSLARVVSPHTGLEEDWLGVQWASKYDGKGMLTHGRPSLSLSIVLDISGSMSCKLEGDENETESKLNVAKRCISSILGQLTSADEASITLFNQAPHQLIPMSPCTNAFKRKAQQQLAIVRPCGGTKLLDGFTAGVEALSASADVEKHTLSRVYFLTDMLSGPADEAAVLDHALFCAERRAIHTTVVGIGVDLSVGTVERLAALPGGKYVSVMNAHEFEKSVSLDFAHDVTPVAFNIKLTIHGGYLFERACGSAELNQILPGSSTITISSEFASPCDADGAIKGGLLLLQLRRPAGKQTLQSSTTARVTRAGYRQHRVSSSASNTQQQVDSLQVECVWETLEGILVGDMLPLHPCKDVLTQPSSSLRKGIALVRFVDLQAEFCEIGLDSCNAEAPSSRLEHYRKFREWLLHEMHEVGDETMGQGKLVVPKHEKESPNANFLQTLDQMISLQAQECTRSQSKKPVKQVLKNPKKPVKQESMLERREASRQTRGSKRLRCN